MRLEWVRGVQAHQLPEVQRMPLESLCLSVKTCLAHVASIQLALARLLSPPTGQAVTAAVKSLTVRGIPGIPLLQQQAVLLSHPGCPQTPGNLPIYEPNASS